MYLANAEVRPSKMSDTVLLWTLCCGEKTTTYEIRSSILLQYHRHDYIDSGCEISLLGCLPLLYTTDGFFSVTESRFYCGSISDLLCHVLCSSKHLSLFTREDFYPKTCRG